VELNTIMETMVQDPIKGHEYALEKPDVMKGYTHTVGRHDKHVGGRGQGGGVVVRHDRDGGRESGTMQVAILRK
jgi:hypothetical protein